MTVQGTTAISIRVSEAPVITWATDPSSFAEHLDQADGTDVTCLLAIQAHLHGSRVPAAIAGRVITIYLASEPGTEVLFTTTVGDLVRALTSAIGANQSWAAQLSDALEFYVT